MASYIIQGETGDWEVVIGLEVHVHILRCGTEQSCLAGRCGDARHAAGD